MDWLSDYEFNKMELPVPDAVFFLNIPPEINFKLMEGRANKITGKSGERYTRKKRPEHLIHAISECP